MTGEHRRTVFVDGFRRKHFKEGAHMYRFIFLFLMMASTASFAALTNHSRLYRILENSVDYACYIGSDEASSSICMSLPFHGKLKVFVAGEIVPVQAGTAYTTMTFLYTPDSPYLGSDSFSFKISDGKAVSPSAWAKISVQRYASPDALDRNDTCIINSLYYPIDFIEWNDWNLFPVLNRIFTSLPKNGTLVEATGYITPEEGSNVLLENPYKWKTGIYYTPNTNFSGNDSFSFKLNDEISDSRVATYRIAVKPKRALSSFPMKAAVLKNTKSIFSASYFDSMGLTPENKIVLKIVTPPTHGTIITVNNVPQNDWKFEGRPGFEYTPDPDFTGRDSFSWQIGDGAIFSPVTSCKLLVRPPTPGGMVVLVVVQDTLLPQINSEINRLKDDLDHEGYIGKIRTISKSKKPLWDLLVSEYDNPTQILSGAILIGNIEGSYASKWGDDFYWNMARWSDLRDSQTTDVSNRHIWVSRISAPAGNLAKQEIVLLKRALQANHDYRTGASRLPDKANYYSNPELQNDWVNPLRYLSIWPVMDSSTSNKSFMKLIVNGSDVLDETSHGGPEAFNGDIGGNKHTWTSDILDNIVQTRFALMSSCLSGIEDGIVNNMLFTRGGGNVLSIGSSDFTFNHIYSPIEDLLDIDGWANSKKGEFISLLKAGQSWGDAWVTSGMHNYKTYAYGDLSLKPRMTPNNEIPVINNFSADITEGMNPLTVNFSIAASDPEGDALSLTEFFAEGIYYGLNEPTHAGPTLTTAQHTYTKPYRYRARVDVVDNYLARAIDTVIIKVLPNPTDTIRMRCGFMAKYFEPQLEYRDKQGQLWSHDQVYSKDYWGFSAVECQEMRNKKFVEVAGTDEDSLYQNWLQANSNKAINLAVPLKVGKYTVSCGFADMKSTAAGQRIMNLALEGDTLEKGFDPYALAGPKSAYVISKQIDLKDPTLNLSVSKNASATQLPYLNWISIIPGLIDPIEETSLLSLGVTVSPNPFNPSTTIKYTLPKAEKVTISVYNVRGDRIATLVNREHDRGVYQVPWAGMDSNNRKVSSGMYWLSIKIGVKLLTQRIILIK